MRNRCLSTCGRVGSTCVYILSACLITLTASAQLPPSNSNVGGKLTPPAASNVQNQLTRLVELTADGRENAESLEKYKLAIGSLIVASQQDPVLFTQQLVEFARVANAANDERRRAVVMRVMQLSAASKGEVFKAVLPYLQSDDKELRSIAAKLLENIENCTPGCPPDFSYYRDEIQRRLTAGGIDADGLFDRVFRRSPGDALQLITFIEFRDDRRKPLLWARHVVDQAVWKRQYGFVPLKEQDTEVTKQLQAMAEREEWWARLYAAEVIRQHPEFGNTELNKRLADDKNELVAKSASEIGKRPRP